MAKGKLAALVLAAGYSSRMGQFKPLLTIGGEYVLARSVQSLRRGGITDIRVVTGHRHQDLLPLLTSLEVNFVYNAQHDAGMFSSILTGVKTLTPDIGGFLLLPGDIPLVRKTTMQRLVQQYQNTDYRVIYPCFNGKRGHPPLITAPCFPAILSHGLDSNLRHILSQWEDEAHELACIDQGILHDMDTPADYQHILVLARRSQLPTPDECQALLRQYQVPEQVIKHGQKVAQLAEILALACNRQGYNLDLQLIRAAGLLHDLAKGSPQHAQRGAQILQREGFPQVARVVAEHTDVVLTRDQPVIQPKTLVYLADKLVQGDQLTTLDEKFNAALAQYGHQPRVAAKIKQRRHHARMIADKIADTLQLDSLDNLLQEKIAQRS